MARPRRTAAQKAAPAPPTEPPPSNKRELSPDTEPETPLEELETTAKTAAEIKRKIQTEKNTVEKDLAKYSAAIGDMVAAQKSLKTLKDTPVDLIASLAKSISDTHVALCEKHKRNAWLGEQLVEAQEHLVAVKKELQELKAAMRSQKKKRGGK